MYVIQRCYLKTLPPPPSIKTYPSSWNCQSWFGRDYGACAGGLNVFVVKQEGHCSGPFVKREFLSILMGSNGEIYFPQSNACDNMEPQMEGLSHSNAVPEFLWVDRNCWILSIPSSIIISLLAAKLIWTHGSFFSNILMGLRVC